MVCFIYLHTFVFQFKWGLSLAVLIFSQVRDYIHVVDLADGHIAALQKLEDSNIGNNLHLLHLTVYTVRQFWQILW